MTSRFSNDETRIAKPSAQLPDVRALPAQKLIDISEAAQHIGFWFPVHITAKAHGLAVRPGTPIGEGLWGALEQAYMLFRNIPRGGTPTQLTFYVPWHDSNQGVVAMVLELHRVRGRTRFAVIATRGERR